MVPHFTEGKNWSAGPYVIDSLTLKPLPLSPPTHLLIHCSSPTVFWLPCCFWNRPGALLPQGFFSSCTPHPPPGILLSHGLNLLKWSPLSDSILTVPLKL